MREYWRCIRHVARYRKYFEFLEDRRSFHTPLAPVECREYRGHRAHKRAALDQSASPSTDEDFDTARCTHDAQPLAQAHSLEPVTRDTPREGTARRAHARAPLRRAQYDSGYALRVSEDFRIAVLARSREVTNAPTMVAEQMVEAPRRAAETAEMCSAPALRALVTADRGPRSRFVSCKFASVCSSMHMRTMWCKTRCHSHNRDDRRRPWTEMAYRRAGSLRISHKYDAGDR